MAMTIQQSSPVAHFPLVLGVVRKLNVAALIATFCPPHPAHVLACGRGVEALVLAILDGHHALYKVGARLEDRGMVPLLQPGLQRASLHDDRLGQSLEALCAANLNRVFGAIALHALEVYALAPPWLHQETTTITLYGAYEEEARPVKGPVPPRPAYGHSTDGQDDLKQVLLSLGVSREGLPLRMGRRDGHTSDSTETPLAMEAGLALGLNGVHGIVADSTAYGKRTLGVCLEQGVGLITLVPRTCAVRQEMEAWGQQQSALPLLLEKPGRTRQEPPRRWPGQSVVRRVPVEYADGRLDMADIRFLVVHSSQLAHQAAAAYAAAQAKEAERVAEPIQRVEARWLACAADAEAAIAEDDGRGQGRRGRKPRPWRYHVLHSQVAAVSSPKKRSRRGRPPQAEAPQVEVR
jgi:transposase